MAAVQQLTHDDLDEMDRARDEAEAAERMPPHDLFLEKSVLGTLLNDGRDMQHVRALDAEHFFSSSHLHVFAVCRDLEQRDQEVTISAVHAGLASRDRLRQVGGLETVTDLATNYPLLNAKALREGVERLRGLWRLRQILLTSQRVTAQAYAGVSDVDSFIEGARSEIGRLALDARGSAAPRPADIVQRWREEGTVVHAPTGLPTLDDACGGGLLVPRRVGIIGAPGAGKTALAYVLGYHYATSPGYEVGFHAIDEDDDDANVRLAQQMGFSVVDCEIREPETLAELEAALVTLPVRFYDGSWTIEKASADLARRAVATHARAVYIVDSVQVVRCEAALQAESPREQVEANMRAIRLATTTHRLLSLFTIEANRNSYRSEDAAEQTNDMAAGAESRAIEFSAQTLLMLRTPKGHPDVVRVTVPKNRRGRAGFEFFLRLDRARHALTECANPNADPAELAQREDTRRDTNRAAVERDAAVVAAVVRANPGLGEVALRGAVRAKGHPWGVERYTAAKRALLDGIDGERLVDRGKGKGCQYHLEPIGKEAAQ